MCVIVCFLEGPLYPFGKLNHVQILGLFIMRNYQNSHSHKNRGDHVSRINEKKSSLTNVFTVSYLSFPQVILFDLISSVFWLHQVVSLEYACINSNSASRTSSSQEDQDVLTFVININLRIT